MINATPDTSLTILAVRRGGLVVKHVSVFRPRNASRNDEHSAFAFDGGSCGSILPMLTGRARELGFHFGVLILFL